MADGSLEALRERNRLQVIDALRRSGTTTRSELSRSTGLSRSTIATLVADLQASGLVIEDEADAPAVGRGRPAAKLRLAASAGIALGVDMGHSHVRVALADLAGTVLAEATEPVDVDRDSDAAMDATVRLADAVLREAGLPRTLVVGAGVGLPGPQNPIRDVVSSATILPGWVGRRPASELSERLGTQVVIDNDANVGALGELTFGAARGIQDGVYVKMSTGIGAGFIFRGSVYRGATGIAGELGHVQVQTDGIVCNCGGRGCLQTVAAIPGVLEAASGAHGPDLTLPRLLELIEAGDFGSRRVVGEAGRAVGRVLADLCNHVNPEAVIVGGDLSAAGEPLLAGIKETIDRHALPAAAEAVDVRAGTLGDRAEVLGALALVIADTSRLQSAGLAAIAGAT